MFVIVCNFVTFKIRHVKKSLGDFLIYNRAGKIGRNNYLRGSRGFIMLSWKIYVDSKGSINGYQGGSWGLQELQWIFLEFQFSGVLRRVARSCRRLQSVAEGFEMALRSTLETFRSISMCFRAFSGGSRGVLRDFEGSLLSFRTI